MLKRLFQNEKTLSRSRRPRYKTLKRKTDPQLYRAVCHLERASDSRRQAFPPPSLFVAQRIFVFKNTKPKNLYTRLEKILKKKHFTQCTKTLSAPLRYRPTKISQRFSPPPPCDIPSAGQDIFDLCVAFNVRDEYSTVLL